jgi:chromosome segregation ATPase
MNEQDFQTKLSDLMTQLESLPGPAREQLEKLAHETRDRHSRMKKTVGELQDSLDYLRLSIKYLVFDLEATRRENQYLRKLIDNKTHKAPPTPPGRANQDHTSEDPEVEFPDRDE